MLGSEKANKILSILTIIFTLSIRITVISSFYGMNINMPGRIEGTIFVIVLEGIAKCVQTYC